MMKTTVILMLVGALIGVVVASFVVPPALAWYTAPGGLPQGTQIQALVQNPEVIRYATGQLIRGHWRRDRRRSGVNRRARTALPWAVDDGHSGDSHDDGVVNQSITYRRRELWVF